MEFNIATTMALLSCDMERHGYCHLHVSAKQTGLDAFPSCQIFSHRRIMRQVKCTTSASPPNSSWPLTVSTLYISRECPSSEPIWMTCGADESAAASSIAMFRQISSLLKWEEAGIIVAPGLHNPREIEGRGELEQAKLLGESI